jgi:thioredoxin 1
MNFIKDVLESDVPVLVDFYGAWCSPCRLMNPTLDAIVAAGYKVVKVDVDENPTVAQAYNVSAVPTFKIFREGVVIHTLVGIQKQEALTRLLD